MADDSTDDGGWETAPSRQSSKNKNKNDTSGKGSNSKGRQRSAGGAGQTRGRGGGGGGGGGFGGWAKPKPPRPQQNAGWPTAPQSNYKESEMRVAPTAGTAAAAVGGGKAGEELTYLNAVPQREMTEQTTTFQSLLKKTSLSDLMADYGEEDKDFDKMAIPEGTSDNTATTAKGKTDKPRQNESHGVLAPHGKAPIHIELVSYGHRYGVPPEAAGKGGYSRSRPLPPFDVRDLRRAPHHVAKLSGLSHHVKRELLNRKEIEEDGGSTGGGADGAVGGSDKRSPVRRRADEVAEDAATALAEAIDGGYGHGSPLDMTVYIESEYGRHRSVVIVEAAAIALRNMLRKNKRGRFGSTTVSVGTRHRDIDRAHRDEEAYGFDLRREAQAAKKQKEREEREAR